MSQGSKFEALIARQELFARYNQQESVLNKALRYIGAFALLCIAYVVLWPDVQIDRPLLYTALSCLFIRFVGELVITRRLWRAVQKLTPLPLP